MERRKDSEVLRKVIKVEIPGGLDLWRGEKSMNRYSWKCIINHLTLKTIVGKATVGK